MAGRKKTETVEAEVVETAVVPAGKMEFRLINPTEDGFLRRIQWNKEELEAAVRAKIAGYENVVYTEENIKAAKNDRAELNKLIKAIEERRKQVKNIINEPYAVFEAELKEITALINEPVALIDQQVKAFEEKQKEEKKAAIKATYDENIGDLAEVLPFEKIFDSNTFENMKHDMNFVLQRLLGNMIEKQSNEGSMTIKIDVTMVKEFIPNYDPNIKGESREISKPQFKHKVTSAVKITDEKGGNLNNEMEMVMDEETGCYVLQPIANTQQRTIFDSDFMQDQKQEGEGNEDIIDGTYIDADVRPALPGPADEEKPAEEEETGTQPAEEETQSEENGEEPGDTPAEEPNEEEPEDITDDILGDADTEGYDYEDPEE